MFDHLHMKLFRSQRNLYISGFSLFLWLVMRRVVTLINQLATLHGTSAALQVQADRNNQAAKKYMENNERLKQKSLTECEAIKRQSDGLAREYDRLLNEHQLLQNAQDSEDKKDN
ncbi:hypothetical protein CRUP_024795 [Coryphaenoides rupestris]|nr:hypothetical protein CRUP_024795 [Coryphaenoides rupestris]